MDAGDGAPLGDLLALVRSMVSGVDVDNLDVSDAARVVEECAEAERLLAALRVVVTLTLEDKAIWRREGYRSVAAWMAAKTGTAVGPAFATLEMAKLLSDLPVLAAAFRGGLLSEAQAREIAEVACEVPDAEEQLVEAAGNLTLRGLREECQRVEAAASIDEEERHRRVHKRRHTRSWVRRGVGHFRAEMTPDELARLLAELDAPRLYVPRRPGNVGVDPARGLRRRPIAAPPHHQHRSTVLTAEKLGIGGSRRWTVNAPRVESFQGVGPRSGRVLTRRGGAGSGGRDGAWADSAGRLGDPWSPGVALPADF